MNHRIGRAMFALAVGLLVAFGSYQWISDPSGREERHLQIGVVEISKGLLRSTLDLPSLEIVDAVAPNRKVGKGYVYREGGGWAVSGFYRRGEGDRWHAYLMLLDSDLALNNLKVQDQDRALIGRATNEPTFEVRP